MKTWKKLTMLAVTTLVIVGLAPAATAQAAPDCPDRPMTRAFSWALDLNQYFQMPGGGFEDGAGQWDLDGRAKVTAGVNETVMPTSSNDSHALNLPSGSSAAAAPLCVDGTATFMRFFARSRGLAGIAIVVVTAKDDDGHTQTLLSPALPLTSAWSAPLLLFRLPLLGDGYTSMTVEIHSIGVGAIDVDDIYIDPLRQR